MKRITNRAVAVLLIAALVICGMVVYVLRYIDHGQEWALYFSRANSGSTGQIYDRRGTQMAYFSGYENEFAPDEWTREANYHVTGDYWGRTGTGVLSSFWGEMQGFDLINGTTQVQHSVMRLNIDAELNKLIYARLCRLYKPVPEDREPVYDEDGNEIEPEKEIYNAAVLVCNYKTGELLGMVSTPSVDPLEADASPAEGAYINRCLSAAFVPGSVFKLVTSAAAIENISGLENETFYCEGEYKIAGVPITCMRAHGEQTFEQALANSCNCTFARLAVRIGQDAMVNYVREYGFLDSQSLDGIRTAKGSYPTEFVGDPEIGWSGIGQSTDLVCPYSMLRFVSAIANGGILIEPKLINDGSTPVAERYMEASTAARLKQYMSYNAVTSYDSENNFPGLNICAKTGTAETGDGSSNAWFVGFLDDDEHPYAFVTMVERGGSGLSVAGTVTNKYLQDYLKYLNGQ